jgi:predicted  nucleic acid-binding Zn-ribbon protein
MAALPQFLTDFQAQMGRLNQINTRVQQSSTENRNFSADLLRRLTGINDRITQFEANLRGLIGRINNLAAEADRNTRAIEENDQEIARYMAQINDLQQERDDLIEQVRPLRDRIQAQENELEALRRRIQELEENVPGDNPPGQEELNQLRDRVAALEAELNTAQDQLRQSNDELEALRNRLQPLEDDLVAARRDFFELTQRNQELEGIITNSTAEIQAAVDNFGLLLNMLDDDHRNDGELLQLLGRMEESMGRLDAALNEINNHPGLNRPRGGPPAPGGPPGGPPAPRDLGRPRAESVESIDLSELENVPLSPRVEGADLSAAAPVQLPPELPIQIRQIGGPPLQIEYQELVRMITDKSKQVRGDNKYKVALKNLNKSTTKEEAEHAVREINIKNGKIMGGKRTKKNRRSKKGNKTTKKIYRGGFTYKTKSKRRSITSSKRSTSRGRSSSRRSTRRTTTM